MLSSRCGGALWGPLGSLGPLSSLGSFEFSGAAFGFSGFFLAFSSFFPPMPFGVGGGGLLFAEGWVLVFFPFFYHYAVRGGVVSPPKKNSLYTMCGAEWLLFTGKVLAFFRASSFFHPYTYTVRSGMIVVY